MYVYALNEGTHIHVLWQRVNADLMPVHVHVQVHCWLYIEVLHRSEYSWQLRRPVLRAASMGASPRILKV